MLICVDGTGVSNDAEYARIFHRSFVNRIYNRSTHIDKIYHRGPGSDYMDGIVGVFGGRHHVSHHFVFHEILTIYNDLGRQMEPIEFPFGRTRHYDLSAIEQEQVRALQERQKIYLTGYSRGGAIVIAVAQLLESRGLPVEAMFLFDAVNRSVELPNTDVIPGNVRYCYHALRHIERSGSRESFSHTGYRRASNVAGPPNRYFTTTHGGMGGTPWGPNGVRREVARLDPRLDRTVVVREASPYIEEDGDGLTSVTPSQERAGMLEVKHWMWPYLLEHHSVTH